MRTDDARRRQLRVLIIVQNLSVPTDRRVWYECQALVAAGYGVSVICPRSAGDPPRRQLDGVWIHTYSPPRATSGLLSYLVEFVYCWIRTALLSLRVLRREGFDAIQACNPPDTYWLLALLYRPFGKRFVYDQHDLCPEVYVAKFGRRGLLHRVLLLLERATYMAAHHVVSTNESYREIARTRGRRSADDTTVVMSAPDPAVMRRGTPEPALKQGRRHLVCYLGIMGAQDGVDRLLHAIDHYVHRLGRDDAHFALLGFGDCLPDLRRLATVLSLDEWVTFTGRVEMPEIRRWLSTADVGVTPDPKNDFNDRSTMNKTLEYMSFGMPVLAVDLLETRRSAGEAAEYVEDEDPAAFAVALAGLLDDESRRAEMARTGRARIVTRLAWDRQAVAYVGVYDRLLRGALASDAPAATEPTTPPMSSAPEPVSGTQPAGVTTASRPPSTVVRSNDR